MEVERIDGYINLDSVVDLKNNKTLEECANLNTYLEENTNVSVVRARFYVRCVCSFLWHGKKYFWKYDIDANPYNELVVDEIANDLGITTVAYDLARIGNLKGLISPNFIVPNANYILGGDLLKECYSSESVRFSNNLESIWFALENRYKANPNKKEIVASLMDKIVWLFILDVLTGQEDRHAGNWGIIEYADGTVDLQPIFDSVRIMLFGCFAMAVGEENIMFAEDILDDFIIKSSTEYVNKLIDSLWVISPENLQHIFKRIEMKTETKIPQEGKDFYLDMFARQLDFINYRLSLSRKYSYR